MMVHGHIRRSKPKTTKQSKELEAEWAILKDKWANVPKFASGKAPEPRPKVPNLPPVEPPLMTKMQEQFEKLKGSTAPQPAKVYTGGSMLGIAVRHKSGLEPVFSKEQAEDLARMRR